MVRARGKSGCVLQDRLANLRTGSTALSGAGAAIRLHQLIACVLLCWRNVQACSRKMCFSLERA
jgi:hypothetical protein